jgi:hypothetical protein
LSSQSMRSTASRMLPPGHDAWSVGDEPWTFVEFSRGNDLYGTCPTRRVSPNATVAQSVMRRAARRSRAREFQSARLPQCSSARMRSSDLGHRSAPLLEGVGPQPAVGGEDAVASATSNPRLLLY